MNSCLHFYVSKFLTPEWLTAIGTVGSVVVALGLAASSWLRSFFVHPKLELLASVLPPNSEKTKWRATDGGEFAEVYYFRLRITNTGKAVARDVHVYLASVEEKKDNGTFARLKHFTPMFLKWANVNNITTPTLWPEMPRFCDLLHITDPNYRMPVSEDMEGVNSLHGVMALDVEVRPNSGTNLLKPGDYRLKLKLAAANRRPQEETLIVSYSGWWYADEEMLNQIKIRKL